VVLLTIDTSVALPALLSPQGHPRKLWLLLAYGAVAYRTEHLRLELDALAELAATEGGEVHATALEDQLHVAEGQAAVLEDLLPPDAPRHYVAAGFAALFNEYERKLREAGPRLDPQLRGEDVSLIRRQAEAVCVAGAPPFDLTRVPTLTRDPEDDPIVYGALLAGADIVLSDDRDIVPDGSLTTYEHGGRRLEAMTFRHFVSERFEPVDFAWRDVDGRWLRHAFAPGGASGDEAT
jgi:predicted nucleic acid-binding protein